MHVRIHACFGACMSSFKHAEIPAFMGACMPGCMNTIMQAKIECTPIKFDACLDTCMHLCAQ